MKKLILSLFLLLNSQAFSAELKAINFVQRGEISNLELSLDDPAVKISKFHVTEDKQIVLDLTNVTATERVMRSFDTSEFSGSVVYVSAYRKPGATQDLRIAIQLRENVRSVLKKVDEKFILEVENRFGVFSQAKVEEDLAYDIAKGKPVALERGETTSTVSKKVEEAAADAKIHTPKSDSVLDILENLTFSGKKRYIGKRISMTVNGVPLEDVLKLIAESSGFNIILSEDVKKAPPLTLNLTNTPWDQVLDTIMDINKLVATKNGNILIMNTFEKATQDKEAELKSKELLKQEEPLLTKVFKISYATLNELGPTVSKYLTTGRGAISPDERTNSLIIKDTAEVLDRVKKIIEVLDSQTPQVLIEAKIVEVLERYAKEIGLRKGVTFGYDPIVPMNDVLDVGPGFTFSSAPTAAASSVFGLRIDSFNRLRNLDLTLSLMESESKGKIISSPKVITQNKKAAKIQTGDSRSFLITTTSSGTTTTSFQEVEAKLVLDVLPQITNEGSILMQVKLEKSQFGNQVDTSTPPPVASRSLETNVLVDNGSTIVIGGIYAFSKTEFHSGIPFLKDIPLIGWLFRTPYNPTVDKNEMMIFLTPRIINQKEAGLSDRG